MKGFKNSTRMSSGFKFPESAGFTSSSGKVQQVRGYTRQLVRKARGGAVPMKQEPGGVNSYNTSKAVTIGDQGNALQGRAVPICETDKESGGKTPLRPGLGYAMGGMVPGMLRKAIGSISAAGSKSPAAPTAVPKAGMARNALGRPPRAFAKGGFLGDLKKGALHKSLGVPSSKKIPSTALAKAANSSSPLLRKRANFAINAKKWNKS